MPTARLQGWTSVQTQLTLVMAVGSLLVLLALILSRVGEDRRIDSFLAADAKEHGNLLDQALELKGSSLATFAKDYTYWDEMVQFVQTGNRGWASQNIKEAMGTYRANTAWVFDPAGSLVYAVRDSLLKTAPRLFPPGLSVKGAFGGGHFCHFFITGPDGPVEIRGATIHPSDDPERKTPVRGYFLAGRVWNQQYLAELARLTGKTLRIEPARADTQPAVVIDRGTGEITFYRALSDPRGKPELALTASLDPRWFAVALRSGRSSFQRQTGLALLVLLGLSLVLWFRVTRPLGLLRYSLATGSARALRPLERNRTEFGQLAQLVKKSFGEQAALVNEVAERKRAEQTLHESKEKYRLVIDNVSEAILVVQDGKIVFANPSASRILSYSHNELLTLSLDQLIHPSDRWVVADGFSRRFAGEDMRGRFGFRILRHLSETRHLEASAVYIEWKGRPATISFLADITESKRAKEEIAQKNAQLVELNNVKNQLLGMAAHDLRNPLSVVNASSTFLLDDMSRNLPEAKRADFLRRIHSSSKFMLKLIDDLLDVAKIEAGKLDLELATGDLCGLIEENLTMNRMLAEKKGIRLDYAPECGMPLFRFDRGKVEQVLNNLISNALKFSAPDTVVTVQASRARDESVVVSVRDQGQGIPAEELDKLFKPFGKTSVRSTAGEKSTGLGLAICRKIVEGHGGRIWAESEIGKGSTFSFSLPVVNDDKSQAQNPKSQTMPQ
jgi:PAS domain S-box-containing protein